MTGKKRDPLATPWSPMNINMSESMITFVHSDTYGFTQAQISFYFLEQKYKHL